MQVSMGQDRVITIDTLRGSVRPVIVSGTKGQVSRSIKAAGPYLEALRERGISVVPLVLSEDDPGKKLTALKAEFRWILNLVHLVHPSVCALPSLSSIAQKAATLQTLRLLS